MRTRKERVVCGSLEGLYLGVQSEKHASNLQSRIINSSTCVCHDD